MNRTGAVVILVLGLVACRDGSDSASEARHKAGEPLSPVETAARTARIQAAAVAGDQEAVREEMEAFQDDFRRAIKLADATRTVDREQARQAVRAVDGVRSAVWLDRENLFLIVESNAARSYDTIDAVCGELDPLGDTLGVVVNLQSGAARNGDELEILSRNCQLAPGDRALLSRDRRVDVIDPAIRRQHQANQALADQDEEAKRRQEESMRALEASTPSVYD